MKSTLKMIMTIILASLVVVTIFNAATRVLGAVIVHKSATIVLAEPCRKDGARDDISACVVDGDLTHDLVSGDAVITLKNGRMLNLPASRLKSSAYTAHESEQDKSPCMAVAIPVLLVAAGVVMLFRR